MNFKNNLTKTQKALTVADLGEANYNSIQLAKF